MFSICRFLSDQKAADLPAIACGEAVARREKSPGDYMRRATYLLITFLRGLDKPPDPLKEKIISVSHF